MIVQFMPNPDQKTCSLIIDYLAQDEKVYNDIPYVPSLQVDHRGQVLYHFMKSNYIDFKEEDFSKIFEFENTQNVNEVKRGWEYMFNPINLTKKKR